MSIRPTLRQLVASTFALALAGCSTTPRFNDHFGESVRANVAAQVLDPNAVKNADAVNGIDGIAAHAAQERYQRSFSETPDAPKPMVGGGVGQQ